MRDECFVVMGSQIPCNIPWYSGSGGGIKGRVAPRYGCNDTIQNAILPQNRHPREEQERGAGAGWYMQGVGSGPNPGIHMA